MTSLPSSTSLSIESLAACFQKTTNSYKFYWFISILEHIKKNRTAVIPIDELKTTMIASMWYPVVYFNLSFGKQDHLSFTAIMLKDTTEKDLINKIAELRKTDHEFAQEFSQLDRYVRYRFLEPFFRDVLRGVPDHQKMDLLPP
jgi:hypothetical protein